MRTRELSRKDARRTLAIVFDEDEEPVAALKALAREEGMAGGHFTALGAFREATLAYFDMESKRYEDIPVAEQVEVASLVGDLALKEDGELVVHAHCVLGRRDGSTVAGHLRRARVRPTLELFLTVAENGLRRARDEATGLDLLRP